VALAFFTLIGLRAGLGDGLQFRSAIHAGEAFARPGLLLPGMRPQRGAGYDGQFSFYIAQDPFLRRPETAASLDNSLRYRRILYPLLAWLLSAGQRLLLPYVLVLINVVAATGLVALAAHAAARAGRTPWAALWPAAFAGVWLPVLSDLTEPLQLVLLAGGFVAGSAGLTLLAALAKETSGVALATEAVRGALVRDWLRVLRYSAGAGVLAAWAIFVQLMVRGPRENTLGGHLLDPPGAPALAIVDGLRQNAVLPALAIVAVAICLAAIARLWRCRDAPAVAAAAYAGITLAAGSDTWRSPEAYFRVMAGVVVLVFLSWCIQGDRLGRYALWLSAATVLLAPPLLLPGK
jgi:hypothetical protein